MRLVTVEHLPRAANKHDEDEMLKLLQEFDKSSAYVARIDFERNTTGNIVSALNARIKKYGFEMKAVQRQNEPYLMKTVAGLPIVGEVS